MWSESADPLDLPARGGHTTTQPPFGYAADKASQAGGFAITAPIGNPQVDDLEVVRVLLALDEKTLVLRVEDGALRVFSGKAPDGLL